MKILVVQAKPRVADLNYNFDYLRQYYRYAEKQGVDVCLFPELITTGYQVEDWLLKPAFIEALQQHLAVLLTQINHVVALIPTPILHNNLLYNGVLAMQNGVVIGQTTKQYLANYQIFDEKRYFAAGKAEIITINQRKIGMPICEDLWSPEIAASLKYRGAEMLLVPNASPYEQGKPARRLQIVKQRFAETALPVIYCNMVLGQDGIIFDGRSFIYDGGDLVTFSFPSYTEQAHIIEVIDKKFVVSQRDDQLPATEQNITLEDELYGAMVLGIREYVTNNGFTSIILGLSGGIDSALVAALAADALGSKNVHAIMMPSDFTAASSLEDAAGISHLLQIKYQVISILSVLRAFDQSVKQISPLASENLQARIRGVILMTKSNSFGSLLMATSNKSEIATGYTTIYGDMCGAFNPVKDLYKTEIFKVAKFRNTHIPRSISIKNPHFPVMPPRVLSKAPTAELAYNQHDTDSLPEYDVLDQILQLYIEQDLSLRQIVASGFKQPLVEKIIRLVKLAEFKRRQSPPGVRLSSKNFEKDQRYPITSGFTH